MKLLLVAVDGSERARGAVAVAVALAARHEARVLLIRVVSMPRVPSGLTAIGRSIGSWAPPRRGS